MPLALAGQGYLQCWRPNLLKKTCSGIASYRRTGPGAYDDDTILAIPGSKSLTVETHAAVSIKGGLVCGLVRKQDIESGILREGGRTVPSADAQPVLEQISHALESFDGEETCTRFESSGGNLVAKVSVNGRYRPDLDQKVIWISPTDGYSVAQ